MKPLTFIINIFLPLISFISSAQTTTKQDTDLKIEAPYKKEITVYKPLSILYPLSAVIRISDEHYNNLTATVNNGNIINEGGGYFIVHPDTLGKLTMKIFDSSDTNHLKLIGTKVYDVVHTPSIEMFFAGKQSGSITREAFLSDSTIHLIDENNLTDYKWQIIFFKISIIQDNRAVPDIYSEGNHIPESVRTLIRQAPLGTRVFFLDIDAKLCKETLNENKIIDVPDYRGIPTTGTMSFTISDE